MLRVAVAFRQGRAGRKVATSAGSRYTRTRAHRQPVPHHPQQMKQHLAVSAIGSDRTGMVHELTRVISECGGNISESRMASLGNEFAMLLLVSGNWHALAKLETELKRLAETNSLSIHLKRTEPRTARTDMLPYSIDVVCLDQTGIVSGLSGFFATRGIDIAEVSTRSYPAAHTGAPMFCGADDRQRAEPHPRGAPARGVHGVLRFAQPRCHSRTGEILKRMAKDQSRQQECPSSRCPRPAAAPGRLKDAAGSKLVIYFYPKDMTSGLHARGAGLPRPARGVPQGRRADRRGLARQRRLARQVRGQGIAALPPARATRTRRSASCSMSSKRKACTAESTWGSSAAPSCSTARACCGRSGAR